MPLPTELLKGTLKSLLLALMQDGDKYGYQIIRELKERSHEVLDTGEGSVYPALHALEQKKFLKSYWQEQPEGPPRKYYALTHKGSKELASAKHDWHVFSKAVHDIYGFQIS